jgi:prefoldin subunit 5
MNYERSSQETIRKLENELNVYKLALVALETECGRLRKLQDETVKEKDILQDSVKVTNAMRDLAKV